MKRFPLRKIFATRYRERRCWLSQEFSPCFSIWCRFVFAKVVAQFGETKTEVQEGRGRVAFVSLWLYSSRMAVWKHGAELWSTERIASLRYIWLAFVTLLSAVGIVRINWIVLVFEKAVYEIQGNQCEKAKAVINGAVKHNSERDSDQDSSSCGRCLHCLPCWQIISL